MRNYVLILKDNDREFFKNFYDPIVGDGEKNIEFDSESHLWIFGQELPGETESSRLHYVNVPDEVYGCSSKFHNFVVRHFKENPEFSGFLHVFDDGHKIVSEKLAAFVPEIEKFMRVFGYDVWMNTITDGCNYIFDKFISRMNVVNDDPELQKKYDRTVMWTSNANTNYMVYDLDTLKLEDVLFDESFSIAMFYIIKFFATRRNNSRPGSFMNFYPTLDLEKGILEDLKYSAKEDPDQNRKMTEEGQIFKEMNIDIHPTENIEEVLKFMVNRLNSVNINNL